MLYTIAELLILSLPLLALTVAGGLLWRRLHSGAALLITLGFAATLVGQATDLLVTLQLNDLVRTHPGDTVYVIAHHYAFPALTHYLGLLGLWAAAAGLLWHARQVR